jgi:hypothetical protein
MSMNAFDVNGGRQCRKSAKSSIGACQANPTTSSTADAHFYRERQCRVPALQLENSIGETIALDQHFTPGELGKVWHWSANTVRRVFKDEPGVLIITAAAPSYSPRRRMVQMRIPARVAMRVHTRLSNS